MTQAVPLTATLRSGERFIEARGVFELVPPETRVMFRLPVDAPKARLLGLLTASAALKIRALFVTPIIHVEFPEPLSFDQLTNYLDVIPVEIDGLEFGFVMLVPS
jgi:hypothetical protein